MWSSRAQHSEWKRSMPRRHTIARFQSILGVGDTRLGIKLASDLSVTTLEAWRHWRNSWGFWLTNILPRLVLWPKVKVWGWKEIFFSRHARSQQIYLPWIFSLKTPPTQGHKPRRRNTRDPVHCIQYRPEKEFLRMTALLVSLENEQPILKRLGKSWKKLKLIFWCVLNLEGSYCWDSFYSWVKVFAKNLEVRKQMKDSNEVWSVFSVVIMHLLLAQQLIVLT